MTKTLRLCRTKIVLFTIFQADYYGASSGGSTGSLVSKPSYQPLLHSLFSPPYHKFIHVLARTITPLFNHFIQHNHLPIALLFLLCWPCSHPQLYCFPKLDPISTHLTKKIDKFIIAPTVHASFSATTWRCAVVIGLKIRLKQPQCYCHLQYFPRGELIFTVIREPLHPCDSKFDARVFHLLWWSIFLGLYF